MFTSLPPPSHFTEAATEAWKSVAEREDGTRSSDLGERARSQGAQLERGEGGLARLPCLSPHHPLTQAGGAQLPGSECARCAGPPVALAQRACPRGRGRGTQTAEPHAHPPSHPPFLPWLVAGEWVSRNRHAAEKTGRRRNQITHLQLQVPGANKS